MRHDNLIPPPRQLRVRSRGRLPHWLVDGAIYSVTFRLRDSLPLNVIRSLARERLEAVRAAENATARAALDAAFGLRLDHWLDRGCGACILREHGQVVAAALQHFDGERYDLHAWCVMPNHVDVLLQLREGVELHRVVHSWKSYTAHQIGRGPIWQPEYFDRIIRDPRAYLNALAYIRANPSKAGLHDWPWVG